MYLGGAVSGYSGIFKNPGYFRYSRNHGEEQQFNNQDLPVLSQAGQRLRLLCHVSHRLPSVMVVLHAELQVQAVQDREAEDEAVCHLAGLYSFFLPLEGQKSFCEACVSEGREKADV